VNVSQQQITKLWLVRGVAGGREGKYYRLNDSASDRIVGRARLHSTGPKAAAILSKAVLNLGRRSVGDDSHGDAGFDSKNRTCSNQDGGGVSNADSVRRYRGNW
jgi:hypothetical protein